MPLSAAQLRDRREFLGASEVAAVLGIDPFSTPETVYWRKVTGATKPLTKEMALGVRLESTVIEWAAEQIGARVQPSRKTYRHPTAPIGATPDALVRSMQAGVEAKVSRRSDEFGEPGTDQIPAEYLVQTQVQMQVCDLKLVYVPVMIVAGRWPEFRLYEVRRSEAVGQEITARATEWWNRHVVARVAPGPAPLEVLRGLRRRPASRVNLVGKEAIEAANNLVAARRVLQMAREEEEEAQARLLEKLGVLDPVEIAVLPDGRRITFKEQRGRPIVNTGFLRRRYPDIYQAVVEETTYRSLRVDGDWKPRNQSKRGTLWAPAKN